jgi:hypothetical protein
MSNQVFDKALELSPLGAPIVATASSTGVALSPRMLPTCDWVIYVTALGAVGTETYVFTLEVSDLVGGTYIAIASHTWPRAHGRGRAHIPINGDMALWQDSDSAFLRVTATLGGTTPTITFGSFLAKAATRVGMGIKQGDIVTVS